MRAAIARAAAAAATAAALAVLAAGTPIAAAYAAAATHAAHGATVTRSAHVALEGCNVQHIILSVTAPMHPFTPNEPVTFMVRLRNDGATTCGGPLAEQVPPARHALTVGPCGTLPLVVRDRTGIEVYPGAAVFHCPDETGFQLGPHSTARTTASWTRQAEVGLESKPGGSGLQAAPPGTYRLTIDGAVTVPVTLTSP